MKQVRTKPLREIMQKEIDKLPINKSKLNAMVLAFKSKKQGPLNQTIISNVNVKAIPDDIKLTDNSVRHWQETKSPLQYTNFAGLSEQDVISIASAAKRGEVIMNVNRWGQKAFYKIVTHP